MYLASCCKAVVNQNPHIIPMFKERHGIDYEFVNKKVKKLRHYDDIVTARMFGYKDVDEYYSKCNTVPLLKKIKTKSLFISALDDPFFGPEIIPYDEFDKNENIFLLVTRSGGHVGFFESIYPAKQWFTKPSLKFFDHLNYLSRMNDKTVNSTMFS